MSMYVEERMSVASIARHFDVHYETAKATLHRCGVKLRPRGAGQFRRGSKTKVKKAASLYGQGMGCEAVAEKLNVSPGTVTRWLRDLGAEVRPAGFQTGEDHSGWSGGRLQRTDGYTQVLIPEDDPLYCMAQQKTGKVRYALEHRIVMAHHLGRPLERHETVHHIDGDKTNNDISNLQLRQGRHGKGTAFRCADCGSRNLEPIPLSY